MRRLILVVASLLFVGCPDETAPPPPPPVTPTPPAPPPTSPQTTTAPESAVAPTSEAPAPVEPAPTPVTVTPPAPPALGDRVRLGSGRLLTATPELRVGGAGVRDGLAQLEVLIGGLCYSVEASAGDVISVGPALLAVDEVDASGAGAAVVHWEREAPGDAPLFLKPKAGESESGSGLFLREQALYKLGDGFVGVGNVRETPDGPRVTLTIFPADYESDPGMGYARDVRVAAGALVGVDGPGPKFRLLRVKPRSADQRWGTILLGPP